MGALVDLHLHTTASDGRLTPPQLIQMVASRGLRVVAVTDHDSTEGLAEAFQAARGYPDLKVLPGIELSTDVPGSEIHILGYYINDKDESFQRKLKEFRDARELRARRMVEKLDGLGIRLQWSRVKELAGNGAVGRPHIARAMLEKGYIGALAEAFESYIGRTGPAYVQRPKLKPEEAVRLVLEVGGLPVVAHPAYIPNLEQAVKRLKTAGLVGMEVFYPKFSPEVRAGLAQMAQRHGLLPCGGSDYHANGTPGEPQPGDLGPPLEVAQELQRLARERSSLGV